MWDDVERHGPQILFPFKKRIKVIGKWRIEEGHYIPAPFYYKTIWFWQSE